LCFHHSVECIIASQSYNAAEHSFQPALNEHKQQPHSTVCYFDFYILYE